MQYLKKIDSFLNNNTDSSPYDVFDYLFKYSGYSRKILEDFNKYSRTEFDNLFERNICQIRKDYNGTEIEYYNENFPLLFLKGNRKLLYENKRIAIVGTRTPLSSIEKYVYDISGKLSQKNITIVSGLAKGVDSMAHKGALVENGKTVAVIPCGLNYCYPIENKHLMDCIVEKGLVVSMFPINQNVSKSSLIIRNMLIGEISNEVILAQSSINGGAKYCIKYCQKTNKIIYNLTKNKGEAFGLNKKLYELGYETFTTNDFF